MRKRAQTPWIIPGRGRPLREPLRLCVRTILIRDQRTRPHSEASSGFLRLSDRALRDSQSVVTLMGRKQLTPQGATIYWV